MPSSPSVPPTLGHPSGTVQVVLVTHDGAAWLPAVLAGLAAQTHRPAVVTAVDTGSTDGSPDLLAGALGAPAVLQESAETAFPGAVRRALAEADTEWVWLLHDDANPAPDALAQLMAQAQQRPDVDILGPKLREWPSLRRILELGVTISGTGRRETGLETGEYDQGQHDEVREVLAVNTAGMLVRRSTLLELGGFDDALPIFGNDLDFGWRAARAGHRTLIVPQAVVFHAEAAHRGVRKTALTGRRTHLAERRAALHTLLANAPTKLLAWQFVRLFFGSLLRVLGFLSVRAVGEAVDELGALGSVYLRPDRILGARRDRRRRAADSAAEIPADNQARVASLLAPRWMPYRHGLDFLGAIAAAATHQAADVAERRRAAKLAQAPQTTTARRASEEEEDLYVESGALVRFFTNPVAVLMALFFLVSLALAIPALTGGLSGPGLSPAPDSAGRWWQLYTDSQHALAQGSTVPAPAYLLPFALLGSLLFGHAGAVVTAIYLLTIPFAAWGAWRFLRVVLRLADPRPVSQWLLGWGAATYALTPVLSGAWGQGRYAVLVAAATLPWLAHAALGFADPVADRRWRAAWRTSLLLALITAVTPLAWLLVSVLLLGLLAVGYAVARAVVADRSISLPLVTPIWVVPVLLLPWWLPLVGQGHFAALLLDAGRTPGATSGGFDVLLGRLAGAAAPTWLGWLLVALALVALLLASTRGPVVAAWLGVALGAVAAALLGRVVLDLSTFDSRPGVGFAVLWIQACAIVAVAFGLRGVRLREAPLWRRGTSLSLVAATAVLPLAGLGWALVNGAGQLENNADTEIPAYMEQAAETGSEHGILVLRGSIAEGLNYHVQRGARVELGEDEVLAHTPEAEGLQQTLRTLLSDPSEDAVAALAGQGVAYIVYPGDRGGQVDGALVAQFDATPDLDQASADRDGTRAWQLSVPPGDIAGTLHDSGTLTRWLLIGLQALAVLATAVLCAPTRKASR